MKNNTTNRLVRSAIIAAIYAAVTLVLAPISFGSVQFRVSEIMVLLAFFDPFYIGGLTLGCFIANVLGGYGIPDIVFGTLATFISVYAVSITKKYMKDTTSSLVIASLWPTIFNGIIVGAMLSITLNLPLALTMLQVGLGEFVVITIVGVPVMKLIKNKYYNILAVSNM